MDVGDRRIRPGRPAPTLHYGGGAKPGGSAREPTRRIVLLTKLKATTTRMGAATQAFFRRGDELAETDWENVPHDDPMLVPPKLGFRSFDRIPRHRWRIVLALLLIAAGALIVLDRNSLRDLPVQAWSVAQWLGAEAAEIWGRLKAFVGAHLA
jgi:hypothetical protein